MNHRMLVLLALPLFAATALPAAPTCALSVEVVDETGSSVAGAAVRVTIGRDVQTQVTGKDGALALTALPCGDAVIDAGQPQGASFAVWGGTTRTLRPELATSARIVVAPRTEVTIRVRDAKGRPVSSGLVQGQFERGFGWGSRPDASGIVKVTVEPGSWRFDWHVGESVALGYPPDSGGRIPHYAGWVEAEIGLHPQQVDLVVNHGERLQGRVLDPDGRPLAGMHVFALDPADGSFQSSAETLEDGSFVVSLPTLPTVLQPASFGPPLAFDPPRVTVQESPAEPLAFVGRPRPRPVLHGRVVRKGSPEPVAGAYIQIVPDCGQTVPEGLVFSDVSPVRLTSNADGSFEARCAPECPFKLSAHAFGNPGASYPADSANLDLPVGACERELVVELEHGPTWVLEGTVTDRKGVPLEGLPVTLSSYFEKQDGRDAAWYPSFQGVRTGENGRFRIDGRGKGRYRLEVRKDGIPKAQRDLVLVSKRAPDARLEVTMDAGDQKSVEVRAIPGATVCARAVDARNAPVPLFSMALYAPDDDVVLEEGRFHGGGQERQGRFCIEGIAPGRYRALLGKILGTVPAWYPGTEDRTAAAPIDVVSGMNELDPVVLQETGSLMLTVSGWSGAEPPGIEYRERRRDAAPDAAPSPWTALPAKRVEADEGTLHITGLPVGRWDFRACAKAPCAQEGSVWSTGNPIEVRRSPVTQATLGLAETTSLLGVPLFPPAWPLGQDYRLQVDLKKAREAYERAPDDPEALIWLGRRTAFLAKYREAIAIFSRGLERWPDDPRLLRHRGHRLINLRRFDDAIADLTRAAKLMKDRPDEVEPDGRPDKTPTMTLHTSVWYYLGVARFLKGEFEPARQAFESFLDAAGNDDARMVARDWLYMTLRRLGKEEDARKLLAGVRADLTLGDGAAPRDRLLLYRGERNPRDLLGSGDDESALLTHGFGVGNWYLAQGRRAEAEDLFRRVVAAGWWVLLPSIAAEAELARTAPEKR